MTHTTPFVTIKEAAALSGLSTYFWRQAVSGGVIPHIKSGNKFYVDYERALNVIRGGEAD